jgi:vitamin B12 transporter
VAYRNAVSNMISSSASLATCDAGFFCYYNVGQATIRGVTLSGSWQLEHYDLRTSLDWTDAINDITGKVLSLRAQRAMTLGVDRRLADWVLTADVQALGVRFDDAANTTVLPGYALLNLNANWQVAPDWQLVLHLDNAFNAQYQQVGGYATPGRTFYAGFRWQPKH